MFKAHSEGLQAVHLYDCRETGAYKGCLSAIETMSVTEAEIPGLLELAHVYDLPSVLKRCVRVLRDLEKETAMKALDGQDFAVLDKTHPGLMLKVVKELL